MPTHTELPRRLEYLPLDDLIPALKNPKGHDVPGVGRSMDRFGVIDIVALDDRTGRLVSGHGRVETFIEARSGDGDPPEGVVVGEDGVWLVPVIVGWRSKDDEEALAAGVALNRFVERGGWHTQGLAELLEELDAGRGLDGVGFERVELDDMIAAIRPPDLDDLARRVGEPRPEDYWPEVRLKAPPEVMGRFTALLDGVAEGDRIAYLVGRLELAASVSSATEEAQADA